MARESLVGSKSFEDLRKCRLHAAHDAHKGIDLGGNWILSWLRREGNRILSWRSGFLVWAESCEEGASLELVDELESFVRARGMMEETWDLRRTILIFCWRRMRTNVILRIWICIEG